MGLGGGGAHTETVHAVGANDRFLLALHCRLGARDVLVEVAEMQKRET